MPNFRNQLQGLEIEYLMVLLEKFLGPIPDGKVECYVPVVPHLIKIEMLMNLEAKWLSHQSASLLG